MATLTTKYSIGDVVWSADTGTVRKMRPCPDCLGAKRWKATSPAGQEYDFACPRCAAAYHHNNEITLNYSVHEGTVRRLTIGQVRVQEGGESEVHYMCNETGVGSGTLWSEDALFATEAEARTAADALAKTRDETTGWVKKLYDQTLRISDYDLANAVKKAAEDAEISRQVRFQMLCEDLRDCETNDEVRAALDRYSERVRELAA